MARTRSRPPPARLRSRAPAARADRPSRSPHPRRLRSASRSRAPPQAARREDGAPLHDVVDPRQVLLAERMRTPCSGEQPAAARFSSRSGRTWDRRRTSGRRAPAQVALQLVVLKGTRCARSASTISSRMRRAAAAAPAASRTAAGRAVERRDEEERRRRCEGSRPAAGRGNSHDARVDCLRGDIDESGPRLAQEQEQEQEPLFVGLQHRARPARSSSVSDGTTTIVCSSASSSGSTSRVGRACAAAPRIAPRSRQWPIKASA